MAGAASNASAQLAGARLQARCCRRTACRPNAPTQDYFRRQVYYRTSIRASKAAAQQVANLFGSADVQPMPLDESAASKKIRHLSNGAMLVVVVGKTYKGNLAPAPKDTTPVAHAAERGHEPRRRAAVPAAARRYVPFQLQNPTVIER